MFFLTKMKMKSDFVTDENQGIIFKIPKNNYNKLPRQSLSNITNQINKYIDFYFLNF